MNITLILKTILLITITYRVLKSKTMEQKVSTIMICVAVIAMILTNLL